MRFRQFLSPGRFIVLILAMCNLASCGGDAQTAKPTAVATITATNQPLVAQTAESTAAATSQPLTLVWQSEYSHNGALASPSDMVVDDQGNSYVSTQSNKNIKKFDSEGKFVAQWGGGYGKGEGQFSLASGIALDAQGNVYVADFSNARIEKFDSTGKFLLQWATRPAPASLGIDKQGNVYVDIFFPNDYHMQKFDSGGKLVSEWGSPGKGDGQFNASSSTGPEDVVVDKDGNIYVADRVNSRIQKFDSNGKFLAKFGGDASRNGHGLFHDPKGIAVDAQGNMYVLDGYFLQKLDPNGNFISQWSTTHGGDLDRAAIIALDRQGDIYVFAHADVTSETGSTVNVWLLKKFHQP